MLSEIERNFDFLDKIPALRQLFVLKEECYIYCDREFKMFEVVAYRGFAMESSAKFAI